MTRSDAAVVSSRRGGGRSIPLAMGGTLIDVTIAGVVSTATLLIGGRPAAPLALALGVVALAVAAWGLLSRGRSVGWAIAGVRLISADTGSAPGMSGRGPLVVADVRRNGDPIAPYTAIPDLRPLAPQTYRVPAVLLTANTSVGSAPVAGTPGAAAAEPARLPSPPPASEAHAEQQAFVARAPERKPAPDPGHSRASGETMLYRAKLRQGTSVMVIDGERSVPVTTRMVVGRNPTIGADEVAVGIPDMSRDLSKNHLRVDQDAYGQLFVTDLASTNGTRLRSADGSQTRLQPHVSAPVAWGQVVLLGSQHSLLFESRARLNESERQSE